MLFRAFQVCLDSRLRRRRDLILRDGPAALLMLETFARMRMVEFRLFFFANLHHALLILSLSKDAPGRKIQTPNVLYYLLFRR